MLFDIPAWELVVRSIAIYVVMVLALRVFGKREIGQLTLFDLVLVLLVANAVQPAMTGPDTSLGGGMLIILTLVLTDRAVAEARRRLPWLRRVLDSPATELARDGAWLTDAVDHEGLEQPTSRQRCASTASPRSTRSLVRSWRRTAASASCHARGIMRRAAGAGCGSSTTAEVTCASMNDDTGMRANVTRRDPETKEVHP